MDKIPNHLMPVKEFAAREGVAVNTVYAWIHKGYIPFDTLYMSGRAYYLIHKDATRPENTSKQPYFSLHYAKMKRVPVVELPWHKDQISTDQLLAELKQP